MTNEQKLNIEQGYVETLEIFLKGLKNLYLSYMKFYCSLFFPRRQKVTWHIHCWISGVRKPYTKYSLFLSFFNLHYNCSALSLWSPSIYVLDNISSNCVIMSSPSRISWWWHSNWYSSSSQFLWHYGKSGWAEIPMIWKIIILAFFSFKIWILCQNITVLALLHFFRHAVPLFPL